MARKTRKRKSKKLAKSVMSRIGPLTMQQRVDYQYLVNQGIPLDEARAIAQSYSVGKSDKEPVDKDGIVSSDVHVPVPFGSRRKKKLKAAQEAKKAKAAQSAVHKTAAYVPSADEMAYVKAAYGLQVPTEAMIPDEQTLPDNVLEAVQANRLVAGMDAEMGAGAQSAEDARRRASRALVERPGFYDGIAPQEVRTMRGLMLDLGCGMNRRQGFLGLDVFAYDYGTILHDLDLGIPFPDGSVRAINLNMALHDIIDGLGGTGDPMPLLTECQRVLMEGGRIFYTGPEPLVEPDQRWPLPGLVLVPNTERAKHDYVEQQLERVPLRVPAYHGADATFAPAGPLPLEVQMAMQAYNEAPADRAMANYVHKSVTQEPPRDGRKWVNIAKKDQWKQIIYGVVLAPDEVDTQGDTISAEEIEKSAHAWMATSQVIGAEHGRPIDAVPVESFIAPIDLKGWGLTTAPIITRGSWVMGVKINDPVEWQNVLDGEYTGFSVGGLGVRG